MNTLNTLFLLLTDIFKQHNNTNDHCFLMFSTVGRAVYELVLLGLREICLTVPFTLLPRSISQQSPASASAEH